MPDPAKTHRLGAYKEMSLQQLRSFCAVCRLGSYASAARALLLTTPAVWEQIKGLERHFGRTLFERHAEGVRPTPDGSRLFEMVRPLLTGLESTRDVLSQQDGVPPSRVRIVSNLRVLAGEISQAMARFRERYPSVRLIITYTSGEEVEPLVLEGDVDVALTLEPGPKSGVSTAVTYEPVGELDYLLVTPREHPLVKAKSIRLSAIVKYPLVLGDEGAYSRQRVHEVFHRFDLTRSMQIAAETSSDEYTLSCVRAGVGIGITIGKPGSPLVRDLAVRPLRHWFGTARIGFLWRRGAFVPPVQRWLAELLRSGIVAR